MNQNESPESNIIAPTIGRKVCYRPSDDDRELGMTTIDQGKARLDRQPMDATIVYVFGNRLVNLVVYDHYGNRHIKQGVTLVQPMERPPEFDDYCHWMPFQVAQAKAAAT